MTHTAFYSPRLSTLGRKLHTLRLRLVGAWRAGPAPCWTEYLRETRD